MGMPKSEHIVTSEGIAKREEPEKILDIPPSDVELIAMREALKNELGDLTIQGQTRADINKVLKTIDEKLEGTVAAQIKAPALQDGSLDFVKYGQNKLENPENASFVEAVLPEVQEETKRRAEPPKITEKSEELRKEYKKRNPKRNLVEEYQKDPEMFPLYEIDIENNALINKKNRKPMKLDKKGRFNLYDKNGAKVKIYPNLLGLKG